MRHRPQFNYPAFNAAAAKLREEGHEVFNPAEKDIKKYGKDVSDNPRGSLSKAEKEHGFDLRAALAADTRWLCLNADAIALLPGWSRSLGACAERALAKALGLKVIFLK